MARYLYACTKCMATEDVEHSIHDDPDISCSYCDSVMKRRPQAFRATYKGDGFTANDKYAGHGDPDKGIPPDLPVEFGGTLDTRKKK